jgi:hypothetical protein
MKFRIGTTEYDLNTALEEISNGTIKAMSRQSALVGDAVTMDYLEKQRVRLEAMQADPEITPLQLGTDVGYIDVQTAYIFIAKRHAGEQITWEQAEAFGPNAMVPIDDDEAEPVVEAPKGEGDDQPE